MKYATVYWRCFMRRLCVKMCTLKRLHVEKYSYLKLNQTAASLSLADLRFFVVCQ